MMTVYALFLSMYPLYVASCGVVIDKSTVSLLHVFHSFIICAGGEVRP